MFVLTRDEAEKAEKIACKRLGFSVGTLMERAGKAVFEEAAKLAKDKEVIVVAGKGNNGGDGFVAARLLQKKGFKVHLFTLPSSDGPKGETISAFKKLTISPVVLSSKTLSELKKAFKKASLVIDAIFGFGFRGTVKGLISKVIDEINKSTLPVLSVDIPSGLLADTGGIGGVCVKATVTVTFTAPKVGLMLYPGCEFAGKVEVRDIGIGQEMVEEVATTEVSSADKAKRLLPPLKKDTHKKERGKVLTVAGSEGMTGAACLTSLAALRAGAGLVTLAVSKSLNPILEEKLTEVMTLPLPETPTKSLSSRAFAKIKSAASSFDVLIVGPGLSCHRETVALVEKIIRGISKPLVLDADGLNALVGEVKLLKSFSAPLVITPHPGELARLFGVKVEDIQKDRLAAAKKAASVWDLTIVLKGYRSIVSSPSKSVVSVTGGPGLATAGTGDVLTGMIGGFLAQGLDAYEAAVLGTYIHGLAADLAARELTEYSLMAGDLLEYLPYAIKEVLEA